MFPSRSRAVQPCATSSYLDRAVSASPYIPLLGGYPDVQVRHTPVPYVKTAPKLGLIFGTGIKNWTWVLSFY